MTERQREILERVASGDLSPGDAEALLNAPFHEDASPPTPGVRRVRILAGFGAIAIVGDPSVAEAEVEGMHTAQVEGDTLVITGENDDVHIQAPGVFAINLGGRRARKVRTVRVRGTSFNEVARAASALRIRINPSLELDAKLDAGPMSISGINAPIRARSAAGPITIDGVCSPVDVSVNAGAIRLSGLFAEGESRVRSDAGAIRIELDPASSVRVVANALVGKVVLPDSALSKGFGSSDEVTIGEGAAVLRVETAMGSINVSRR